ncbi:potassium transporter TrkA [Streptomyces sp. 3MP-14]|uniref:Potassium transporter TrkA n=1 Tax=Streptomyces mimosae TaxID=2586635 RepID=A0A5N6A4Y2_9ACTN|nr:MULTISPECIES: NAD(P)-binding protein [Streptomyces]KAB8163465.1 potassium transporter TrkA [Streptomyces mimosae]KAB8174743.1 potassium transporter TrkA [Streptomyces sp. 3MP-14]
MIVCGDDALAVRLAEELHDVYRERVTLVMPPADGGGGGEATVGARPRVSALIGRVSAAINRPSNAPAAGTPGAPGDDTTGGGIRVPVGEMTAADPTEEVLRRAGVANATALALVYDDDETNLRGALAARRLNPHLRLVIRHYNRRLGQHLAQLLDQAASVALPDTDPRELDAATTVLSDADTAAPALAATAVAGTRKVVRADGLLLRAVERNPPASGEIADPGLCTLALLSATVNDPAGAEGSDNSGPQGPQLLPDDRAVGEATGRGTVVLETVTHAGPALPPRRLARRMAPLAEIFSRRLRYSLLGVAIAVLALALTLWRTTGGDAVNAAYLTLLDLFAIGDPAVDEPVPRQTIQLVSGLVGLALLPILIAAALQALGAFRGTANLPRPPRGLSGHVVLLGLGKIGTRVLAQLREMDIPVVCVEEDPEARGIPLARRLQVPVVLGDVTQEDVLESAKIHRARALLALTSADATNLEAVLHARSVKPDLRVALRLYDDDFATVVYRTLRAAHPEALTRSRSVSTLAAPAFASAMMGRQILGAIPVERKVLLFAALEVADFPRFEGRTVAEASRPGAWRVLALDLSAPGERHPDLSAVRASSARGGGTGGLLWDVHPGYVLRARDRVVVAATRRGLAELLGRGPAGTPGPAGGG